MTAPVELVLDGAPFTVNASHRMHHQVRARHIRKWRKAAAAAARAAGVGPMGPCRIVAYETRRDRRAMRDVGACYEAVKAAVDGIRDAGAWDDDDPTNVPAIEMRAPQVTGVETLVLRIEPLDTEAAA